MNLSMGLPEVTSGPISTLESPVEVHTQEAGR